MTDNNKIILIGNKDALNTEILMTCITNIGLAANVIYSEDECFA